MIFIKYNKNTIEKEIKLLNKFLLQISTQNVITNNEITTYLVFAENLYDKYNILHETFIVCNNRFYYIEIYKNLIEQLKQL